MSGYRIILVFFALFGELWSGDAASIDRGGSGSDREKYILEYSNAVIRELRICILSNFQCGMLVETHRMQDRISNFVECLDETIKIDHVYSVREQYVIDEIDKGVWVDFYQQEACPKFVVTYVRTSPGLPKKVDVGVILN